MYSDEDNAIRSKFSLSDEDISHALRVKAIFVNRDRNISKIPDMKFAAMFTESMRETFSTLDASRKKIIMRDVFIAFGFLALAIFVSVHWAVSAALAILGAAFIVRAYRTYTVVNDADFLSGTLGQASFEAMQEEASKL